MRVAVIGAGPVGLVMAVALSHVGHGVRLVEHDALRAAQIAMGQAPFHEPGLEPLLKKVITSGRLGLTAVADAVRDADVVLICVGTPSRDDGADISMVLAAARDVGSAARGLLGYRVVAIKSTVPPGTTSGVVEPALRDAAAATAHTLGVAMNPEFLREGAAVEDALHPDRIVIGAGDERTRRVLEELYRPFGAPVFALTPTGAEMAKYASNYLLSTLVSFSNEIAAMCESKQGLDALDVLRVVHADRRFAAPTGAGAAAAAITSYLLPGLGYGGSCFPKDTQALAVWARAQGVPSPILDAVRAVNGMRPARVLALLGARLPLKDARVAVLGLSFKPGSDDLRESRSLDLVRMLHDAGAEVRACDPVASPEAAKLLDGAACVGADVDAALRGADAAVLATAWPEYLALVPDHVCALMRRPLIVDTRRALNAAAWSAKCEYLPIGMKP
jgi:UDPglucose 6-dehydrogenase